MRIYIPKGYEADFDAFLHRARIETGLPERTEDGEYYYLVRRRAVEGVLRRMKEDVEDIERLLLEDDAAKQERGEYWPETVREEQVK